VSAVPTIPVWRLSSIPKALPPEDLDRFLRSFDRSTPGGRRDYAMALCMADCGLRACEVAALRLKDVDWRQATLRIPATKTLRSRLLPLTSRVGRAIAAYLRNGRPQSPERGLFLLRYAPWTSATTFTVRRALMRAYERSDADPWSGPHALRHTLATRMVQQGARIKEIADVLGHARIDTTFIYTKVNLPMLRRVAMPWPREVRA
jgi:integrase/recombinase XerD